MTYFQGSTSLYPLTFVINLTCTVHSTVIGDRRPWCLLGVYRTHFCMGVVCLSNAAMDHRKNIMVQKQCLLLILVGDYLRLVKFLIEPETTLVSHSSKSQNSVTKTIILTAKNRSCWSIKVSYASIRTEFNWKITISICSRKTFVCF